MLCVKTQLQETKKNYMEKKIQLHNASPKRYFALQGHPARGEEQAYHEAHSPISTFSPN